MNPFRALTEKPWENTQPKVGGLTVVASQASLMPAQKVALMFFLGVISVMFGLFIMAYFIRMGLADWRPMPESQLLWLNTFLLFVASLALQWTHHVLSHDNKNKVKLGLLIGAVLTLGFVFGQITVWQQMFGAGFYVYNNPANSFFYVLTGIHALHILGGLWVWIRAGVKVWSGASPQAVKLSVELCTFYWHFLLLVWLAIFALFSNT